MSISVDLLVTVVCAKDLLPKDDNGLSDPYVVLKVGRTQCRTKVVRKSLNPTFNESFVLFAFSPSSKKYFGVLTATTMTTTTTQKSERI